MTRQSLPPRRPNITRSVRWETHDFTVTLGIDPATGCVPVFTAEEGATGPASPVGAIIAALCEGAV